MKTTTTNLFATATKVKETTKKTDKKIIQAPELADKIKRFAVVVVIRIAIGRLDVVVYGPAGVNVLVFTSTTCAIVVVPGVTEKIFVGPIAVPPVIAENGASVLTSTRERVHVPGLAPDVV